MKRLSVWVLAAGLICVPLGVEASVASQEIAIFGGGCFWCMEAPFDKLEGVVQVRSGYSGGSQPSPTYESVSAGKSGHAEVVEVTFDPKRVSYGRLLEVFWRNVDPLDAGGQFCDRGDQYRSEIFYTSEAQAKSARESLTRISEQLKRWNRSVATRVSRAGPFYPAEDYHQHYYRKNPIRYRYYRSRCGRDARLKELWGADATH